MLARYREGVANKKAKVEATFQNVNNANVQSAQEAGMTLNEWHKQMSERGQQSQVTNMNSEENDDEIAKASARWLGGYHAKQLSGFLIKRKK